MLVSRIAGAAAALGLLLAGIASAPPGPDAAASAASGNRSFHLPEVGSCHQVSDPGVVADRKHPVPCSGRHNLLTIATPVLHGSVDWNDQDQLASLSARYCLTALIHRLGSERRLDLSAYDFYFFAPSKAERAKGASWMRCDLGLAAGRALLPLPARVDRLPRPPYDDEKARCLTQDLFNRTSCARPHQYRAVATVRGPSGSYPTKQRWYRFGRHHCARLFTFASFHFTYPGPYAWKVAHQRLLVCYARTTR